MNREQMPLAEVKDHLSEVVDVVGREHARVVITKHGRPVAVVVSAADLESLEETLDIIRSAALLADIKEAVMEIGAGAAVPLSKDEALRPADSDGDPLPPPALKGCSVSSLR